jgi:hypothetical protein
MGDTRTTATQVGRDAAGKVRESVAQHELAQKARDAAYTVVGLGVMGAQKATAATKQAATKLRGEDAPSTLDVDALRARTKDATEAARRHFSKVDEVLVGAIARLEDALSPIEERLPGAAKDTVQKAKGVGKELHAQVRDKVAGEIDSPKPAHKKATDTKSKDEKHTDADAT